MQAFYFVCRIRIFEEGLRIPTPSIPVMHTPYIVLSPRLLFYVTAPEVTFARICHNMML